MADITMDKVGLKARAVALRREAAGFNTHASKCSNAGDKEGAKRGWRMAKANLLLAEAIDRQIISLLRASGK